MGGDGAHSDNSNHNSLPINTTDMTMKKAKSIGAWLLGGFCLGVGVIIGWIAAKFTWTAILVGFFSFIGFVVLAVLVFAAIFDDTTEQEEEFTYPKPQTWDKSYEHE